MTKHTGKTPDQDAVHPAPATATATAHTSAADKSASPVYALDALAALVGAPDEALMADAIDGMDPTALVETGRTISSDKVLTDATRLLSMAWTFSNSATPTQIESMQGFSKELLAIAIHQAGRLERMVESQTNKATSDVSSRAQQDLAASQARSTGIALRDQAYEAMRDVTAEGTAARQQVEDAVGTAEDGTALARGIGALGEVLKGWQAGKDLKLHGRLKLARLDAAYVTKLLNAAAEVRKTSAVAKVKPTTAKATQNQLDFSDGVTLDLLGKIIRAFESGHTLDTSIPRLVPISTRRLFNHRTKKAAVPGAAPGASGAPAGAATPTAADPKAAGTSAAGGNGTK